MAIQRTPEVELSDRHESPHGVYYIPQGGGSDPVLSTMAGGNLFEQNVINACLSYIVPETTVIDVGCNFGQMTVQFSRAVGPLGTVHSIEASSFVIDYLKRSLPENTGCTNVVVHHAAAWDQSNLTKKIYIPSGGESWGGSGLGLEQITHSPHDWEEVQSLAIDDIPLTSPVSLIKIDVQGSDWHALAGARNVLLRDRPTVIFEYEPIYDTVFGKAMVDYLSFLEEVNYEIIDSVDNNNHDFICRPRGRVFNLDLQ